MSFKTKPLYIPFVVVGLLGFGTIFFHIFEGWSYVDAFYFSTMTVTTVGYGDLVPTTDFTKIATALYALVGISAVLYLFSTAMAEFISDQHTRFNRVFGIVKRFHKFRSDRKKKNRKT